MNENIWKERCTSEWGYSYKIACRAFKVHCNEFIVLFGPRNAAIVNGWCLWFHWYCVMANIALYKKILLLMAYSKSNTMHLCAWYKVLPHFWKEVEWSWGPFHWMLSTWSGNICLIKECDPFSIILNKPRNLRHPHYRSSYNVTVQWWLDFTIHVGTILHLPYLWMLTIGLSN